MKNIDILIFAFLWAMMWCGIGYLIRSYEYNHQSPAMGVFSPSKAGPDNSFSNQIKKSGPVYCTKCSLELEIE